MTQSTRDTVGIASQVVELVRAASPSAQAEVVVDTSDAALTRFANSFIHQNVAESTVSVRLRLHADGRTAAGSSTIVDTDGLKALVDRTVGAAALCPPDPQWPGLAAKVDVPDGVPVDEETANADPAARAERVRLFVAAAGGLETAGYCSTSTSSTAFANSAGQSAVSRSAQASLSAIARDGKADGVARLASWRLSDLDGTRLGERAAAKARASVSPQELAPGRYEVVFEPTAVFDVMQNMAFFGFNGKAMAEQRSFVEPGAAQFDPSVFLIDDPIGPDAMGLPFDVEGTPKRLMAFIEAGVSTGGAHDRRSAALAGTTSTGHALPGGVSWGAIPVNLHLLPARSIDGAAVTEVDGPAADSSVSEVVSQVGRGLLVSDLWYTRVLDPRSLVVTGLTRNGVWLIEDGVITSAVQNMRFTQSYPQALAPGAVLDIGTRSVATPGGWDIMTYRAPALRLASWNFTGNASG
jgi:predicted Zn-dependent protease